MGIEEADETPEVKAARLNREAAELNLEAERTKQMNLILQYWISQGGRAKKT